MFGKKLNIVDLIIAQCAIFNLYYAVFFLPSNSRHTSCTGVRPSPTRRIFGNWQRN